MGGYTYQKNQRGIWRQWADLEEVLVCVGKGHVHTGVLVIGMALTVQPQSPVDTTGAGAAVFGVHRVVVRTPLLILWEIEEEILMRPFLARLVAVSRCNFYLTKLICHHSQMT